MEQLAGMAVLILALFVFLSLLASGIELALSSMRFRRQRMLQTLIYNLLADSSITQLFLSHPVVESISYSPDVTLGSRSLKNYPRLPVAIPKKLFRQVLQSSLRIHYKIEATNIVEIIRRLPEGNRYSIREKLITLIAGIEEHPEQCEAAIEEWYEIALAGLDKQYKRNTQRRTMVIGTVLALACNANMFKILPSFFEVQRTTETLDLLGHIYQGKGNLEGLDSSDVSIRQRYTRFLVDFEALHILLLKKTILPIGRQYTVAEYLIWIREDPLAMIIVAAFSLVGWLLTGFAISLGAPFWLALVTRNKKGESEEPMLLE